MKIVTVIGARPQFVKAGPLSLALRERHDEVLVHTGQHYDRTLSGVFFEELGIPAPRRHLGIGSGSHGAQTGAMLAAIEAVLLEERPDAVLVYGDTNSTLAGALAAAKLHVPIAHVEAGLRSFNRAMPEEVNRVLTDHLSEWLFAPGDVARRQLEQEGITRGVHVVGDIMLDAVTLYRPRAENRVRLLDGLRLTRGGYLIATVHRAENTDDPARLHGILSGLAGVEERVVVPLHPRTRKRIKEFALDAPANVTVIEPVGYLDMLALIAAARLVLTDSGGVQKEAFYLDVPCVTLRTETEWIETVAAGWNVLAGTDPARIVAAVRGARKPSDRPAPYGDGRAAARIVDALPTR